MILARDEIICGKTNIAFSFTLVGILLNCFHCQYHKKKNILYDSVTISIYGRDVKALRRWAGNTTSREKRNFLFKQNIVVKRNLSILTYKFLRPPKC